MPDYAPRYTRTWSAIATLVGSTVGIGFLAIPYTVAKSGFGIGVLSLICIYLLFLFNNLFYGEIVLRTHFRHQFVGYVKKYLGQRAEKFSLFTFWIGVYGSVIGTLIVSGQFLSQILASFKVMISPEVLSTAFFIIAVFLVYRGLKTISFIDFIVLFVVFLTVIIIGITGFRQLIGRNFVFSTGHDWSLPFGVILFALNGLTGIPLARELLVGQERKLKKAIIWGTTIPALFYLFFSLIIVGISGTQTSNAAILGLEGFLGHGVVVVGLALGLFTSTTIFISGASAFKESLAEDFQLRRKQDFVLFILPAYILFIFGVTNFTRILGLVGGVAVSLDMIMLLIVYVYAKRDGERIPEYAMRVPKILLYAMMLVFFAAALYTLFA